MLFTRANKARQHTAISVRLPPPFSDPVPCDERFASRLASTLHPYRAAPFVPATLTCRDRPDIKTAAYVIFFMFDVRLSRGAAP